MDSALSSVFALPQAHRIRCARELRGLTQREAVQLMESPLSPSALSQIENGRARPSEETVRDLALALEVPVGFLTAQWSNGGWAGEPAAPFFRDLRTTSVRERKQARAFAMLLTDLIAALDLYVRLPEVQLPRCVVRPEASNAEIERAAATLRTEWSLDARPIPHVVRELERHGVVVARLALGHRHVDAFSIQSLPHPIVLLTEDKSNYVRSRFDAAHELGHLVMHMGAQPGTRQVETQAHDFASAFLFPREVAEEELPRRLDSVGWTRLAELKRRWGLSMGALLFRARDLRILSADAYRNAMKYISAKGWRVIEPGDREMGPPEAPLLVEQAIREMTAESGMTVEDFVNFANLPMRETIQLIQAAADRRPILQV